MSSHDAPFWREVIEDGMHQLCLATFGFAWIFHMELSDQLQIDLHKKFMANGTLD